MRPKKVERNGELIKMSRLGKTHIELARLFNISIQRVGQITKTAGIVGRRGRVAKA